MKLSRSCWQMCPEKNEEFRRQPEALLTNSERTPNLEAPGTARSLGERLLGWTRKRLQQLFPAPRECFGFRHCDFFQVASFGFLAGSSTAAPWILPARRRARASLASAKGKVCTVVRTGMRGARAKNS